ncbi:MAG TPA: CRTAC1 family protein [Blastocatellia bacterium]|nr:CRTAC1 family protein [Blastocatellia bacterium]
MRALARLFRIYAARITACAVIFAIYGFARLPALSEPERAAISSRFGFARLALPELGNRPHREVRTVHPEMQRIAGWISSVGAAVSLNDLDGDGLPNDVCVVDTRTDQVVVAPVPGTPARYGAFELDPSPLPFDAATMAPMGGLPGDFNEDGLTDILVYYWGRAPIIFLRAANRSSQFPAHLERSLYAPTELIPNHERWYSNCATQADLDGDGHIDLIIGNYFPDGARVLDANDTGSEHMQRSMSRAFNGGRSKLLLWTGARQGASPTYYFKQVDGVLSGDLATAWTLAVGAADLNGDMLPEIYFANDFGPDRLLYNRSTPGNLRFDILEGKKALTTPNSKVLGKDSFKGMGVDFADLNGDGLLDIYVSNIADEYSLEESHFVWVSTGEVGLMDNGVAPYVDRSEQLGLSRSSWGWDARLVDLDNDGAPEALQATGFMQGKVSRWPELHELAMSNDQLLEHLGAWPSFQPGDDLSGRKPCPIFVRASNGRYYDLAADLGLGDSEISRGIAVADANGDGRLDFARANQWMTSYFYLNESPDANRFLGLHILLPVGVQATAMKARPGHPAADLRGRPAIGAVATVHLPEGRKMVAQVDGGSGHSGKRSPDLHFGLGNLSGEAELHVDIDWRDLTGKLHRSALRFKPGWHTVLLGQ